MYTANCKMSNILSFDLFFLQIVPYLCNNYFYICSVIELKDKLIIRFIICMR
jgi:hypothetical protein